MKNGWANVSYKSWRHMFFINACFSDETVLYRHKFSASIHLFLQNDIKVAIDKLL